MTPCYLKDSPYTGAEATRQAIWDKPQRFLNVTDRGHVSAGSPRVAAQRFDLGMLPPDLHGDGANRLHQPGTCRVVGVLGIGGIGKTSIAAKLAHDVAPAFQRAYWRSLRNAPPVSERLADAIGFLSDQRRIPPEGEVGRLAALLKLLRDPAKSAGTRQL